MLRAQTKRCDSSSSQVSCVLSVTSTFSQFLLILAFILVVYIVHGCGCVIRTEDVGWRLFVIKPLTNRMSIDSNKS